jgi:DNA-binding transcriptional LysR family regulator
MLDLFFKRRGYLLMLPTVDFERLRTFYLAAKTGKFNATAELLGIDTSSVTRQIQGLERDLNCILFGRGGFRGLQLTEKGKALQVIAHDLFTNVARIEPALSKIDNEMEGPLKICVHGYYSFKFLSSCIYEFMEKYPNIPLELITSPSLMDVSTREADISIGVSMENHENWIERKLFTYNSNLYASQKYLEIYGIPKDVDDLRNHRFVSAAGPSVRFFSKVNWYLELIPNVMLTPYFVSNSSTAIVDAIKKGIGIGSMSPQFFRGDSDLIPILPHISGPALTVNMVYGEHFQNSKKVETLYSFLQERINLS